MIDVTSVDVGLAVVELFLAGWGGKLILGSRRKQDANTDELMNNNKLTPDECRFLLDHPHASVRDRLKQRDFAFQLFGAAVFTLFGVAFRSGDYSVLLAVPGVALAIALFSAYHEGLIDYLDRYIVRVGGEDIWENSPEFRKYCSSKMRWSLAGAQGILFGGSSILALVLNLSVWSSGSSEERVAWCIDVLATAVVILLVVGIRRWRHSKLRANE